MVFQLYRIKGLEVLQRRSSVELNRDIQLTMDGNQQIVCHILLLSIDRSIY